MQEQNKISRKNLFSKFLFVVISITTAVIISFSTIFFIAPVFRKNDIVPANVFVFGNELSEKVKEEINNAVALNIEKIYNQLITNVQFAIALFSCALVLFTIVFGFLYFTKIREAENLIKDIQKTPDLFFKQFYREQFNKNMTSLFSNDYIKRSEAIKNLASNPEIANDDYDIFQNVLLREFDNATNIYFYNNVSIVTGILIKIDHQKTISLLRKILQEREYDMVKHNTILSYVVADNSQETKEFIQGKLLSDSNAGTQLISLLITNGEIDNYMNYILERCNGTVLQIFIGHSYNNMWHIKTDTFFKHLVKREDIDIQSLNSIISHEGLDIKDKIGIVLYFYHNNIDKYDQSLKHLISMISDNDSAKDDFINIVKKLEYQFLLKDYFNKNKYLKSYFEKWKDDDVLEQDIIESNNKEVAVVIKELGLYINDNGTSIVDKDGQEYPIQKYSRSMFGPIFPVMSGIMIDGTFIDVKEIK
jgi:hypothetical protein